MRSTKIWLLKASIIGTFQYFDGFNFVIKKCVSMGVGSHGSYKERAHQSRAALRSLPGHTTMIMVRLSASASKRPGPARTPPEPARPCIPSDSDSHDAGHGRSQPQIYLAV